MSSKGISVVTTTYNEKENLAELISRLRNALANIPHEIIVVDDSSPDHTYEEAQCHADIVIKKDREGQTAGLLYGIKIAKYPVVLTIDADLENPPEIIPDLLSNFEKTGCDILVASRESLPRLSERIASKTLGRIFRISDVFSNYRIFRRACFKDTDITLGETFGAELLLVAKTRGYLISESKYKPQPRRQHPRIGGKFKAELRIFWATTRILRQISFH